MSLYKGGVPVKGALPHTEDLTIEDIPCCGFLSDEQFMHCRQSEIRACVKERGYTGCHQCDEFPCKYIEAFPMTVGEKIILRAIPYWREVGTERRIQDEEARYVCPECTNKVFEGAPKRNRCGVKLDLDQFLIGKTKAASSFQEPVVVRGGLHFLASKEEHSCPRDRTGPRPRGE